MLPNREIIMMKDSEIIKVTRQNDQEAQMISNMIIIEDINRIDPISDNSNISRKDQLAGKDKKHNMVKIVATPITSETNNPILLEEIQTKQKKAMTSNQNSRKQARYTETQKSSKAGNNRMINPNKKLENRNPWTATQNNKFHNQASLYLPSLEKMRAFQLKARKERVKVPVLEEGVEI